MSEAENFYDKLLASLGPKVNAGHPSASNPVQPVPLLQPTSQAEPQHARYATESPQPLPPTEEEPVELGELVELVELVEPAEPAEPSKGGPSKADSESSGASEKTPEAQHVAMPVPTKSSADLEAELRAKLLASKKRKAGSPESRRPSLPTKRPLPNRGSPVFTAVPLSSPLIGPTSAQEPKPSKDPPSALLSSKSTKNGKLSLPAKPAKRDGFRLRIKLPFSYPSPCLLTVETEKLPLTTPISGILDLLNRRSPLDYLFFPSPSPSDTSGESGTPGRQSSHSGQSFYRSPSRGSQRPPPWDDTAIHSGPGWEAEGPGKLQSTLEDVVTISGAEFVECEVRTGPRKSFSVEEQQPSEDAQEDEIEDEWVDEGQAPDSWNASPEVEQGEWAGALSSFVPQIPQQNWQYQWAHVPLMPPAPTSHQPTTPLPGFVSPGMPPWGFGPSQLPPQPNIPSPQHPPHGPEAGGSNHWPPEHQDHGNNWGYEPEDGGNEGRGIEIRGSAQLASINKDNQHRASESQRPLAPPSKPGHGRGRPRTPTATSITPSEPLPIQSRIGPIPGERKPPFHQNQGHGHGPPHGQGRGQVRKRAGRKNKNKRDLAARVSLKK